MQRKSYDIPTPFRITSLFSAIDYKWDKNFMFKGEDHDFWEIVTVMEGEVEVVENEQTYLLHRGEMILHAPGDFHRIKSAGGTSPHVFVLSFANTGALPDTLKDGVFALGEDVLEEYRDLFYVFHTYTTQCDENKIPPNMHDPITAKYRLEAFLISLSLSKTSKESIAKNAGAEEYRRLVQTMSEHVREPLTLEKLASMHHISASYVKKLFSAYAGNGPMSYFSALRIKEIQALLSTGYSVSQVSRLMGFSSTAYLSTFFKKKTGISPSKYYEKDKK
ncbi:MAG: helix-turn-helix transcriptional regulator [Ruminococcaceae bacterium]|nr:helix-turn-helix transcriptional regulator [Oscillospiraceae bacterium]